MHDLQDTGRRERVGVQHFWTGMLALLLLAIAGPVAGHGSVTAGDDACVIRIGFYTAHFKIYQPGRSGHREFCEDLPATGETVFVMEYLHESLGEVPIEFRIIRNPTGLGRFTRAGDLPAAAGLDALTLLHRAPETAPDVLVARHEFARKGDYVGMVTARHPVTQQAYVAVFPFAVGGQGPGLALPLLVLLLLAQAGYWWSRGSLQAWLRRWMPRLALLLLVPLPVGDAVAAEADFSAFTLSRDGRYRVRFEPDVLPLPLNLMHGWMLQVQSSDGQPADGLELSLSGGMPAHDHGLPSAPQVQALAEPGRYRVEGLRFHMQGEWVLQLLVRSAGREDLVRLAVRL